MICPSPTKTAELNGVGLALLSLAGLLSESQTTLTARISVAVLALKVLVVDMLWRRHILVVLGAW